MNHAYARGGNINEASTARVRTICGPRRSDRTLRIDALLQSHWGRALLIVPTHEYAQHRREQLILGGGLPGAWGNPVVTFRDFALHLLQAEGIPVDELSNLERRLLLEQSVASLREKGALDALGASADTRGFVTHLQRTITQLKQAAIEPAEFRRYALARANASWLDPIVADAYEAYQIALHKTEAYDLVGLYWRAAVVLEECAPKALHNVSLIALDGFDDFTPSEFRLIRALAPRLDELAFGIACTLDNPSQADLYAIPLATLERIRTTFGVTPVSCPEPSPETYSDFAAASVFWRDPPGSPVGLRPNIELLPCTGPAHEAETIARRIKRLILDQGAAPEQIAVVYRDLAGETNTVLSAFHEAGIPLRLAAQPSLAESAVGRFLTRLLVSIETWEREAVADVLASPWFNPPRLDMARHKAAVRSIARTAGIVRGYDEWLARLEALQRRIETRNGESVETLLERHPDAEAAVAAMRDAIAFLGGLHAEISRCVAGASLADGLQYLVEHVGIAEGIQQIQGDFLVQSETNALAALHRAVGAYAAWHGHTQESPKPTSYGILARARQILSEASYALPQPAAGVVCLDPETIRHLAFDYVFLAGMNEGSFPRPAAINAIYTDDDLRDLRDNGIDIETRRRQTSREMLLFHHVLSSVRQGLHVSWSSQSREGREASPSPFLADLRDLFAARPLPLAPQSALPPTPEDIASWRDLRCTATAAGCASDDARGVLLGVLERAAVESRRQSPAPFDCFDGVLSDNALVEVMAHRFGAQHVFSVNQLETYAECPFRFFLERVLSVKEEPFPSIEFDPRVRGSILHEILQRFHEQFRGQPLRVLNTPEAEEALQTAVDTVVDERSWESRTASKGIVAVERERIRRLVLRYLALVRAGDDGAWRPSHFEVAFGKVKASTSDPLNRPEPFALETDDGPVLFSGIVDRVDLLNDGARIVDYKSTVCVKPGDIEAGVSLQLPIYALALQEYLLPSATCEEALLIEVGGKTRLECLNRTARSRSLPWPDREAIVRAKTAEYVRGIRAGTFAPVPYGIPDRTACRMCAGRRACRFERVRVERKEAPAR